MQASGQDDNLSLCVHVCECILLPKLMPICWGHSKDTMPIVSLCMMDGDIHQLFATSK